MTPEAESLFMYGEPSDAPPLPWEWVDSELARAGTYWVTAQVHDDPPHPRPVWGIWADSALHLSIGSPALVRSLDTGSFVGVHLPSSIDVVIVEGKASGTTTSPYLLGLYNAKYQWNYTIDQYGPLTTITPTKVLAWRSSGVAGRDGFQATGRWRF